MIATETFLPVRDYDLSATLGCGQAFRWRSGATAKLHASRRGTLNPVAQPSPAASSGGVPPREGSSSETLAELAGATPALQCDSSWEGVVGRHWVRLQGREDGIAAQTAESVSDWQWLSQYLQVDLDYVAVLRSLPADAPMRTATAACRGLRLLRQDPWECLASFIASSTKQIVQIQQIVAALCARFGDSVAVPEGCAPAHAFPAAHGLAQLSESDLRACKLGFRAPYLLQAARAVASGELDLAALGNLAPLAARETLMTLPGVGEKIANCVLLFACGFQEAFPVDVWVARALRQLYFPRQRPTPKRLRQFVATHFGPKAGYAQQYLFHYMRLHSGAKVTQTSKSAVSQVSEPAHSSPGCSARRCPLGRGEVQD